MFLGINVIFDSTSILKLNMTILRLRQYSTLPVRRSASGGSRHAKKKGNFFSAGRVASMSFLAINDGWAIYQTLDDACIST